MIRDVADLLLGVLNEEIVDLDRSAIRHGPTIGDMYEGLSTEILRTALPEGLGLTVTSGFISDGGDLLTGQIDCMIVRTTASRIPYTGAHICHIRDVIAVVEVKKTLYAAQLAEAFEHLNGVRNLEGRYLAERAVDFPDETVNVEPALRAFAETTGKVARFGSNPTELDAGERMVLDVLLRDNVSVPRIILGVHGYKSEHAFRSAMLRFVGDKLGAPGYGPGSFPDLIISGNYSLIKASGRPFTVPMRDGAWPFCLSSPINPLRLLLEIVWTRLSQDFGLVGWWGEDLDSEMGRILISAQGVERDGRRGWDYFISEPSKVELEKAPAEEPWSPAFLSLTEFVVINKLCEDGVVDLSDPQLVEWLTSEGSTADELKAGLLATRLVAMDGGHLVLTTSSCVTVVLPTGEYVAADDNSGRLQRWLGKRIEEDRGR